MRSFFRKLVLLSLVAALAATPALACPDIDGLLDLNCDGQVKIVTFGDSITFGKRDARGLGYPGRLNELFPLITVLNFGVPGEDTYSGSSRAPGVFDRHEDADFVILLEGVNDYWRPGRSSSSTRSNLLSMVDYAEDTGAVTLLCRLTDTLRGYQRGWVIEVNSLIKTYTSINFFVLGQSILSGDELHPDGPGYQEMAELVADVLEDETEDNRPIDTDDDGIYDFAEAQFGTEILVADTDGDGLLDGAEVFTYGSSPTSLDSDDDGYNDFDEVAVGADPADAKPGAPVVDSLEAIL